METILTYKNLKKYLPDIILIATIIGILKQFLILFLFTHSLVLMIYFSPTYIIVEGLSYLIQYFFLVGGLLLYANITNYIVSKLHRTAILLLLSLLLCFIIYGFFLINSYFTIFPVIMLVQSLKAIFKKPQKINLDHYLKYLVKLYFIIAVIGLTVEVVKVYSTSDNQLNSLKEVEKEFARGENSKMIYANDLYIFIKKESQHDDKIIIKKIETLIDEKSKELQIKK